jgi:dihydroorotase
MAACGIIGLETALALGITNLVVPGFLTLSELIEKMSTNPAKILKIDGGAITVGRAADLVIFDENEEWLVDPEKFKSKSRNTPFSGFKLRGRVRRTILSGRTTYDVI